MIEFKELPNGDLQINLLEPIPENYFVCNRTNEMLAQLINDESDDYFYLGEYHMEVMGHLTDSPVIGLNSIWDEQGELIGIEKQWYSPDYMLVDELEELINNKTFTFKRL